MVMILLQSVSERMCVCIWFNICAVICAHGKGLEIGVNSNLVTVFLVCFQNAATANDETER